MSMLLSHLHGLKCWSHSRADLRSCKNWFLVQSFSDMLPIFQLALSIILFTTLSLSLPVHPVQNEAVPKRMDSLDYLEAYPPSSTSGSVHRREPEVTVLMHGSPTTLSDIDVSKYTPLKRQQVAATPEITDTGASSAAVSANPAPTTGASDTTDQTAGGTYQLLDIYKGKDFLNPQKWQYWSNSDPTHGSVNYQAMEAAMEKKLAFVGDDGIVTLAVDDTTTLGDGEYRDSVRISSVKTYNSGLFIASFSAMPYGCSVWPAWWTVGDNWPHQGEIDVLENVHNANANQYTFHTGEGCTIQASDDMTAKLSNQKSNQQCAVSDADNSGCGMVDTANPNYSYGKQFNQIGGGVFAHLWNDEGIRIWHFPKTSITDDITAGTPDPANWGKPAAFLPNDNSCDTGTHFINHSLVIDTTLCGDWANATYSGAGCPGTCAEAVKDPKNYKTAKWKINYIAVYSAGGSSTSGTGADSGTSVETGTESAALSTVASSPVASESNALLTQRFVTNTAETITTSSSSIPVTTGSLG
ncbi:concanavalin A-like lectin/glucanase domain-containing protein [Desarmillaria tabescens]|uniref:Concanavalin A-like lectin/glucanase domain-containing protein n=1 Tax=Armillaria tabescens TaxID=1929756 RepID=A0AA39U4S8_ARMTA|nr:concanavalin A-like lectin/glucanase domain-containing protein [Desarmillaria tabescens]KAK0467025.1 concanavalin A-like lectin/glucanase domain-containing protein [Desarmillaria tabescens]